MPIVNAISVDPDQMPGSAASNLGLHCLPMSHLWDAGHKWVKIVDSQTGSLIFHTFSACFIYLPRNTKFRQLHF